MLVIVSIHARLRVKIKGGQVAPHPPTEFQKDTLAHSSFRVSQKLKKFK
ncbi:hypothetical protein [Clostridium sp.]